MPAGNTWYKAWRVLRRFDNVESRVSLATVGQSDSRLTATTSYHQRRPLFKKLKIIH